MKGKLLAALLILAILSGTLSVAHPPPGLVVLVRYKALPGQEEVALRELKILIAKVRQEPNYEAITLHVDPADKTNILLYEEWSDAGYYKDAHMKTVHLQDFISASRAFLAGPPDISFWNKAVE